MKRDNYNEYNDEETYENVENTIDVQMISDRERNIFDEFESLKRSRVVVAEDIAEVNKTAQTINIVGEEKELPNEIDEQVIQDYNTALDERLAKSDEETRKLFNEYADKIVILSNEYDGTPNYDYINGGVNFDIRSDLYNQCDPGSDFLHEVGHMVDDIAGKDGRWLSDDPELLKMIHDDVETHIETCMRENHCDQDVAYKILSKELQGDVVGGISDLYGSVTNCQCQGDWGHEPEYWEKIGYKEKEAFAHMFEAGVGSIEKREMMQKYLPNAYTEFKRILKGR